MRTASFTLIYALAAASSAHAGAPTDETLPSTVGTIALLEFNGNTLDTWFEDRHATLIGGSYVSTRYGMGLRVVNDATEEGIAPMGIDWSPYAGLLVHPYTVEILFTPTEQISYRKLFSSDDTSDSGWYVVDQAFTAYPSGVTLAPDQLQPNQLIYLAIVSTAADQIEVYVNGRSVGTSPKGFSGPPAQAIFFRDDSHTGRDEQLTGTIDVLRISDRAFAPETVAAVGSIFPYFRDCFEAPAP